MKKLRACLIKNEIFFKLISSILFGAAALFVSVASYNLSSQQLVLARRAADPHFYIRPLQQRNAQTGFFDDSIFFVNNDGAPVDNIGIDSKSFIVISGIEPEKLYLPVGGYFCCQENSRQPTGQIARLFGPENNKKFHALYLESLNRRKGPTDTSVFLSVVTAIKVTYTTKYGARSEDYFLNEEKVDFDSWMQVVRFEIAPLQYELGTDDFDTLLKKAADYAKFIRDCTMKRLGPHSFTPICK